MRILKTLGAALAGAIAGAVAAIIAVFVVYLNARPHLEAWHVIHLAAEYTAAAPLQTFEGYVTAESRLFSELDERVYSQTTHRDVRLINRYIRGSMSDPARWSPNWNRTFELRRDAPRAGVLLLHGMSDSPYTLHTLGERLHAEGVWVVGLRLPGHGTVPSGLTTVRWQDMSAAVCIAMRHLHESVPHAPLFIVGYSTGGALAIRYSLDSLRDRDLPQPAGLILISPAIAITPVAAFAVWQARLGRLLGLETLAWSDLGPEYDPFKYGSFAVNAADQVYQLTSDVTARLRAARAADALRRFPPVLVFQSALDATVSVPAVATALLGQLPAGRNELVLFDINRITQIQDLLSADPEPGIEALMRATTLPFRVSVVTNESRQSRRVIVKSNRSGTVTVAELSGANRWPEGVFSLSHVALPVAPTDPLYGMTATEPSPGIQLGNLAPRGERDALQVTAADVLRLRCNPFYGFLEGRALEFVRHDAAP